MVSSLASGEETGEIPAWLETARERAVPGQVHWLSGRFGAGAGKVALTAALRSEDGELVYALHVASESVEAFIDRVVLPEAEVMVVRSDGTVIRYSRADDKPFVVVDMATSGDTLSTSVSAVVPAYLEWRMTGPGQDPFMIRHEGEVWWAVFKAVGDETAAGNTVLGVTVPEAQIVSGLERTRSILFVLLLLAVAIGIALLVVLGLLNARRLAENRTPAPPSASEIVDLIRSVESETLEFKATLRWNLNKDRPGKEVEISAMKTVAAFLNSGGGTLLVGVTDDGQVVGTENDRFPNEDRFLLHFNNLVKEHLGLAHGGSLTFGFRDAQGKRVFFVRCGRSQDPVFLKTGSSEKFYVRLGPGSRELKPSQVLAYIKSSQ
jgi:hypothetical protein